MKRLIALVLFALLGFYIAWPAWSGYRIYTALQNQDASLLASKIDFDSVRASLRPFVAAEVEREAEKAGGNIPAPLRAQLQREVLPKIVDTTMVQLLTPETVLRIYREGGDATGTIRKILAERLGGIGGGLGNLGGSSGDRPGLGQVIQGLGGLGAITGRLGNRGNEQPTEPPPPAAQPATAPPAAGTRPKYGMGNIKGFGLSGPFGWRLGLAKDPAAAKPELTAGMSFTGLDWKLTSLEINR